MDKTVRGILRRLNVEQIRNDVIWDGEARGEPDPRAYDERLHEAEQRAIDGILAMKDTPSPDTEDAAIQEIHALLDTAKDVYTTVGMRVGAELAEQRLQHEGQGAEAPEDSDPGYTPYPSEEEFNILHSKDFIERMTARVNLQALGAYIRDGATRRRLFEKPLSERVEEANHELNKQVKALTRDKESADKMHDAISGYESAIVDVYFSLGMKTGSKLNALLMGGFDKDY